MGTDQQDGVSHAIRLAALQIGDEVVFVHHGKQVRAVVTGWCDRVFDGRWKKCVMLARHASVPVDEVVSRHRLSGSGAGYVAFSKDAGERRL